MQPRIYGRKDQLRRHNALAAAERLEREIQSMLDRCPRDQVLRDRLRTEFMHSFTKLRALWGQG
jgi:hypothetical protein